MISATSASRVQSATRNSTLDISNSDEQPARIASNEIANRHRVGLDETVQALAQTAKDMNSKYKETSEAGLALSVALVEC